MIELFASEFPPFLIRCEICKKEAGECCTRWEGAPGACQGRVDAAVAIFGKWKYKNGKYTFEKV